ncbi:MAG TPA: hypothetical protein VN455_05645 [Methanotrichaceae archaeon]|nr:hypothetical protein [Methanotrichaceae archaeon]
MSLTEVYEELKMKGIKAHCLILPVWNGDFSFLAFVLYFIELERLVF